MIHSNTSLGIADTELMIYYFMHPRTKSGASVTQLYIKVQLHMFCQITWLGDSVITECGRVGITTYIVWLHGFPQENGLLVQPLALLIMHPMGQSVLHPLTTYTKTTHI